MPLCRLCRRRREAERARETRKKKGPRFYPPRSTVRFPICTYCGSIYAARATPKIPVCSAEPCVKRRNADRQRKFLTEFKEKNGYRYEDRYRAAQAIRKKERIAAGLQEPNRKRWPNASAGSDAFRAARKRGADGEKFSPREVFERDGWMCGICTEPVDPELRYPDPSSASLDHVVPISLHGPHTRANTRCSHLRCNVLRGAALDPSQPSSGPS